MVLSIASANNSPRSVLSIPHPTNPAVSSIVFAVHNTLHIAARATTASSNAAISPLTTTAIPTPAPLHTGVITTLCSITIFHLKTTPASLASSLFTGGSDGIVNLAIPAPPSPSSPNSANKYDITVIPTPPNSPAISSLSSITYNNHLILAIARAASNPIELYTALLPTALPAANSPPLSLTFTPLPSLPVPSIATVLTLHALPDTHTLILAAACAVPSNNKVHIFRSPLASLAAVPPFLPAGSLPGHQDWIRSLSFTPPSMNPPILASSSHDQKVRLWTFHDAITRAPTANNPDVADVDLVEDSIDVDTLLGDAARIVIPPGHPVTLAALLISHEESVSSTAWHPTSPVPRLLTSSMDRTLLIWEADTDSTIWLPTARLGAAGGILGGSIGTTLLGFIDALFEPDGNRLIGHGYGGSLHCWETDCDSSTADSFVTIPGVTGHFGPVRSISWDPSSHYLLSTSADQTTRLWAPLKDTTTYLEMCRPQVHGHGMTAVCALSSELFVSGADEKHLRIFAMPQTAVNILAKFTTFEPPRDPENPRVARAYLPALGLTVKGGNDEAEEEGIENEGGELLCEGNFMTERDLGTLTLFPEVCKLFGHDNDILVIAAARSHGQFASACRARDVAEACIRLWDFDGGVAGEFTGGHKSSVVCLEFTEDERFLASSGKDRRICVWDREKRELVAAVDNAHKRIVWGLSWHDGVLLSGGRDGAVKLWRVEGDGLVCVHEVAFKGESVTSVHFKPTPGFVFAAGFESGRVKVVVWVEGGQGEEVTELLDRHGAQVRSVKWRPDGEAVLASCGDDHAVKVHLVE